MVDYAAVATEILAVAIILVGIASATYSFLDRIHRLGHSSAIDRDYRQNLGRTLLLGLEVLVAADVVRTVALDPTIESTAVLGLLILIRTFLSWSLVVEIEHRWPWQAGGQSTGQTEADAVDRGLGAVLDSRAPDEDGSGLAATAGAGDELQHTRSNEINQWS